MLWKLAWSYLRETAKHGGDWLPTPENASRMVQIAMGEADQGLPCFLAEVRGRAVGFAIAWELKPLLETKGKICQELWIYVDPRYRGGTLAAKFRCLGLDVAQSQGYTRTDAFSMNQRVPVGSRFRMILFSFMHTEG